MSSIKFDKFSISHNFFSFFFFKFPCIFFISFWDSRYMYVGTPNFFCNFWAEALPLLKNNWFSFCCLPGWYQCPEMFVVNLFSMLASISPHHPECGQNVWPVDLGRSYTVSGMGPSHKTLAGFPSYHLGHFSLKVSSCHIKKSNTLIPP